MNARETKKKSSGSSDWLYWGLVGVGQEKKKQSLVQDLEVVRFEE